MNSIDKPKVDEIIKLHFEIYGHFKVSLDKAQRIGELLTEQKDKLEHGEFIPWIKKSLPFSDRTARNYMRLYSERDQLKMENVSVLSEAYKCLCVPNDTSDDDDNDMGSAKYEWGNFTYDDLQNMSWDEYRYLIFSKEFKENFKKVLKETPCNEDSIIQVKKLKDVLEELLFLSAEYYIYATAQMGKLLHEEEKEALEKELL